jgi:hypothetical protein
MRDETRARLSVASGRFPSACHEADHTLRKEHRMGSRSSVAALQSRAAKSEQEFADAVQEISDATPDEFGAFFSKLNIPRTLKDTIEEGDSEPDPKLLLGDFTPTVTDLAAEVGLTEAFSEFHIRHLRKLQWHASRPDPKGVANVRRLYRAIVVAVQARLLRTSALLEGRTDMSAEEWGNTRALINKAMADFRDATEVVTARYGEALAAQGEAEDLAALLAPLKATVSKSAETIEELRATFEKRRQELAVVPTGYPPVKPAPYFTGDVLEAGTWTRYRSQLHEAISTLSSVMSGSNSL